MTGLLDVYFAGGLTSDLISGGTLIVTPAPVPTSTDEIVITCGCTEALNLSLRAVCRPGELVAVESPTYFGILQVLQSHGLRALEIPTHPVTGISLEALRFAGACDGNHAGVAGAFLA